MKKTKLKEMKETLSDDYDRIKSKIQTTDNRFAEPRVQEFWRRAQKANFTGRRTVAGRAAMDPLTRRFCLIHPLCLSDAEEELLSLEEELTHFQRKIEKHDWIRNQVDDVESDVKEGWCDSETLWE